MNTILFTMWQISSENTFLTHFWPMYLHLIPPKNTRKLFITLCFQGVSTRNICQKCVTKKSWFQEIWIGGKQILREKCAHSKFFLSVLPRIQSECGKIRTRKTPNKDTFHAVCSCLKFWILKACLRLSPAYLMPRKDVIVLFPKAVLCYNFRSVCLHYDDKDIHKLSSLTFRTLHTKKTKLYKINCHFWFIADDIENRSFLTFETLNLVPSSFFLPKIGYWWKYLKSTSTRKVKWDGY